LSVIGLRTNGRAAEAAEAYAIGKLTEIRTHDIKLGLAKFKSPERRHIRGMDEEGRPASLSHEIAIGLALE
jgi:hypothetical protein